MNESLGPKLPEGYRKEAMEAVDKTFTEQNDEIGAVALEALRLEEPDKKGSSRPAKLIPSMDVGATGNQTTKIEHAVIDGEESEWGRFDTHKESKSTSRAESHSEEVDAMEESIGTDSDLLF